MAYVPINNLGGSLGPLEIKNTVHIINIDHPIWLERGAVNHKYIVPAWSTISPNTTPQQTQRGWMCRPPYLNVCAQLGSCPVTPTVLKASDVIGHGSKVHMRQIDTCALSKDGSVAHHKVSVPPSRLRDLSTTTKGCSSLSSGPHIRWGEPWR